PNPVSNGRFTIKGDFGSTLRKGQVIVRNAVGQMIKMTQFSQIDDQTYQIQIDEGLPPGAYILSVVKDDQRFQTKFMLSE
ncbi:MAG: T9SS type A sorting domain-containing protein, partial [Bacteroidota bacterium]